MATETKLLINAVHHIDQAISSIYTIIFRMEQEGNRSGGKHAILRLATLGRELDNISSQLQAKHIRRTLL